MMRWFILILVLCFVALLIAAGAMLLHVFRQHKRLLQAKDTDSQVESISSEEHTHDS